MSLDGREYLTFDVNDSSGVLTVSFDDEVTWHPLSPIDATSVKCLVAGPEATSNPVEAIVLPAGSHEIWLAREVGTERLVRQAPDRIDVE